MTIHVAIIVCSVIFGLVGTEGLWPLRICQILAINIWTLNPINETSSTCLFTRLNVQNGHFGDYVPRIEAAAAP